MADPYAPDGSTLSDTPAPLLGTVVDGIRLVRKLGEGGFASVYEGRQAGEPAVVAVKVMHPDKASPGLVRRFEYEAELLARLDHPGIARVHRLARLERNGVGIPCIVMEIIPAAKPITKYAGDLQLPVRDRLELVRQAAEAIGYGHRHGVLHRDIKPGNILVGPDGKPRIIDYGWARGLDSAAALQSAGTVVGQFVGTWQYMSPEQFDPDPAGVDLRADVYALGAVLQELLTGKPPHGFLLGPLFNYAIKVRDEPPMPLPRLDRGIDQPVCAIVAKCLAKDRNRRYSSALDLAEDLRRCLAGEPIAPATPGLRDALAYLAKKHAAAATAAAVSLAALVAATIGIGVFSLRTDRALRAEAETATMLREESRRSAAEAARATAAADNARHQLYVANLHRLAAPDAGPVSTLQRLFHDTAALVSPDAAPGISRELPLELLCLRPRVIQPVAATRGTTPADVVALAVSPTGDRFATGAEDGVLSLHAVKGSLVAIHRFDGPVECLHFTGPTLVAASRRGRVQIADAATGDIIRTIDLGIGLSDLAVDRTGTHLAIGCDDGSARLVSLAEGRLEQAPTVFNAHRKKISSIGFSPDGRILATLSTAGIGKLFEIQTDTGVLALRELRAFEGDPDRGTILAFSPDGRWLATPGPEQALRLVDVAMGTTTTLREGPSGRLTALAFSPDSRLLAAASRNGTAVLLEAAGGRRPIATLVGHRGAITALAFVPDGHVLATASADRTIRLWRSADGFAERTLEGHDDRVDSLAWAPDGASLLSAGNDGFTLRWDTSTPDGSRVIQAAGATVDGAIFLPRTSRFLTWSRDGSARICDASTAAEILRFPPRPEPIRSAAVSPDGSTIAFGGDDDLITLHDARDGRLRNTLRGHAKRVTTLDFSPDGLLLASASEDGTARIWNAADGSCQRVLEGHAGPIVVVRFAPDGQSLATASRDGTARVWSVPGEGPAVVLTGHGALVRTLDFSPDSQLLATGSDDGTARLWEAGSDTPAGTLQAGTSAVTQLAFVGDKRLVTGTMRGGLDLWDVATATHVTSLDGHSAEIRALATPPDGTRIATASSDRTARLWDGASGVELVVLRGHSGPVTGLVLSSDGHDLVTTSDDTSLRVWSRTDAEINEARRLAGLRGSGGGKPIDAPRP